MAGDLLNLEVNTIVKSNITCRKMNSPAHTLIDIAKKFNTKLTALKWPCDEAVFKPGSFKTFELIRDNARKGIHVLEEQSKQMKLSQEQEADLIMLWRIKTMSDQIIGIFKRKDEKYRKSFDRDKVVQGDYSLNLTGEELVQIRKIWEIGTEVVAAQTVIQADGDVITRINPAYTTTRHQQVLMFHDKGVRTSVDFWQNLVKMVANLLGSLLDKVINK